MAMGLLLRKNSQMARIRLWAMRVSTGRFAMPTVFSSPIVSNNATSVTFGGTGGYAIGDETGAQVRPVVADVNSDGLWDLIVVSETTTNVFVNVGSKGNPQFANCGSGGGLIEAALPWCDMNSTAKLAAMSLDVEPVGALSATTNGATLLVSDDEGRIWYYSSTAVDGNRDQSTAVANFQLPAANYRIWASVVSVANCKGGLLRFGIIRPRCSVCF